METSGWVLFLDQVYPYHLREVLSVAHLFRSELSDDDYGLLDDYFGSDAEIRSRPSAKFLAIWPRYLELIERNIRDVERFIEPVLSPRIVRECWMPALQSMINGARENPYVIWTSITLCVNGVMVPNGPVSHGFLIRRLNANLDGAMRSKAKEMLNFDPVVSDYLGGLLKTYTVIGALLNNRPEYLLFNPRDEPKTSCLEGRAEDGRKRAEDVIP